MPVEDFFARLLPAFAHTASATQYAAERHAAADTLIAKAEYELFDMQRELMAAMAVPLRHRAVKVEAGEPETAPAADAAKAA